ncbi:hypothetical protein Ndes2526B_g07229 [Nannochloris sp. 'desiccata']
MDDESVYKIKRVKWPPGASNPSLIPILLQDVNGPCPLLAIMNVLLLRQSIDLPAGAGEVTQSRAVQILAEHLLDTNFSRSEGGSNAEFRANLQHNLSDAIALLPKLCSGLDVNVRFDGVRSIEFTGETAVFDLLGIDLCHGWLVDPQDVATAAAIGQRSYNDVVLQIVAALGRDATPASLSRRSTAVSLGGAGGSSSIARGSSAPPHNPASTSTATTTSPGEPGKIDAATLSAALQSTLRVTIPEDQPIGGALRSRSLESCRSQDSVTSAINKMLGETVKEAFKTPTVSLNARSSIKSIGDLIDLGETPTPTAPAAAALSPSTTTPTATATTTKEGEGAEAAREAAVREALLSQEFLESNSSQLTVYGLSSLLENMGDQQLAVFFRNNHFNVLLRSGVGLYILVTDQGYLYEPEIVWEHLNNVDGDTELLGWDLKPFKQHTEGLGAVEGEAAEGSRGESCNSHNMGQVSGDAIGGVGGGGVNVDSGHGEDADFALAMQLQQEEEERIRVEQERRRASTAAAAAAGRGGGGRPPVPGRGQASRQQQQEPPQPQQQQQGKKKKKGSNICSVM